MARRSIASCLTRAMQCQFNGPVCSVEISSAGTSRAVAMRHIAPAAGRPTFSAAAPVLGEISFRIKAQALSPVLCANI